MKTFKTFLLIGILSLFSRPSSAQVINCVDTNIIDQSAFCTTVFDPVCGCDGVTYNNACEAWSWYGVTSWTPGPCSGSGCQADFTYTLGSSGSLCDIAFYGYGASTYSWDFGDGNTGSGQNTTHTYSTDGNYYVCLFAFNPNGVLCDTVCYNVWVAGCSTSGCQADFGISDSTCTVELYGVGASGYSWDFGDGTSGTGQNTVHTYSNDGTYTVCLYALNANGQTCDTVCHNVYVTNCGNPCTLTLYDTIIPPSCYNSCDGIAEIYVSGGSPPYTFLWSNGMTGSYSNTLCCGTYIISVTDSQGCTGTTSIELDCPTYLELTATGTPESSAGTNDGTITAQATGGTPSYMYSIDNGNTYQTSNIFNGLSAGVYVVNVMDNHGCVSNYTIVIESGNNGCQASFSYTLGGSNCDIMFVASGASSYNWSFGDGNTGTGQNITHTYATDGNYYVLLMAYNSLGHMCDSVAQNLIVTGCDTTSCDASFYLYTDSISNCTVSINNTTQGASSYLWDFGDGTTSTLTNPVHTYSGTGSYTITLNAYNSFGVPCMPFAEWITLDCTSGLNEHIADFGLEIYPNPTTHGGKVDLTLPMSMNVDVKILSIMGKTADVIYTGHLDSGRQSIQWTNYDLASGMYIIQISTPYGVQKKKLLIQR